jgi:hypothetical protein
MWYVTLCVTGLMIVGSVAPANAQQPFSFVITTADRDRTQPDSGDALAVFAGQRLDPLTGIETTLGRLTVVALEDSRFDRRDPRQAHQAEVLVDVWGGAASTRIAAGTGIRGESQGTNVLLTRVVAETSAFSGRVIGNVIFEKPLVANRDALDVLTTLAYTHHVARGLFVGAEALLQDIEGFWTPAEAEGGARLFVGPSVGLASAAGNWAFHLTAGREVRATQSIGTSEAFRALGETGFVMRVSTTHRL